MTAPDASGASTDVAPAETVTGTIDGRPVTVPKGTMIIRAAERLGLEIPRFCDHPLLDPVAACRMCLIEIEGMPKPQPSCAVPLGDGMVVKTGFSSSMAETAQRGVMEFLLINHPLDCPVCDKGGECPLQNQAMTSGQGETRFTLTKREFPKPVSLSTQILLDRERCVSCARCIRFADEVAGDPFISLQWRGAGQRVGIGEEPFNSHFSGNTVQICPVGALTSVEYRFRSRPFDLVSVPTVCEHCASGCGLRTDYRHDAVTRRQAWEEPSVNEDWNCDKGRFAFTYLTRNRLTTPSIREEGQLRPASWPEALRVAAQGLAAARGRAGVLVGGRMTLEDAYGYARFARVALGSDDIDFRARPASREEADFLAARIAGSLGPTYADLQAAPSVLLVGFEPEEESPIVFLRLRKSAIRCGTKILSIAPFESTGLRKLRARLIPTVPGAEVDALVGLTESDLALLHRPGAVILAGERVAESPGASVAAAELADRTGARLAWVPRRAGERAALDAGCLPGLLPGGRPLDDPAARAEVAAVWGVPPGSLPTERGRDLSELVAAAAEDAGAGRSARGVEALLVGGVEAEDLPDREGFLAALRSVPFVVSLETRPTDVTRHADVVLPVAVVTEKAGTFVNWEGRLRPFPVVFGSAGTYSDAEVLALLGHHMGLDPAPRGIAELREELASIPVWSGARVVSASTAGDVAHAVPGSGEAVLATWRQLLDLGLMQEGEPYLAGTAKETVVRVSAATAAGVGVADGEELSVSTEHGSITLPARITRMPDGIVWLPTNSSDSRVRVTLRAGQGASVRLGRGDGNA